MNVAGRYNAVFHLVTSADGAEQFYTNAGGHRLEPPDLARMLDGKTLGAWRGHHNLTVFDNESSFAGKTNAVVEAAAKVSKTEEFVFKTRRFRFKTRSFVFKNDEFCPDRRSWFGCPHRRR